MLSPLFGLVWQVTMVIGMEPGIRRMMDTVVCFCLVRVLDRTLCAYKGLFEMSVRQMQKWRNTGVGWSEFLYSYECGYLVRIFM